MLKTTLTVMIGVLLLVAIVCQMITRPRIKKLILNEKQVPKKLIIGSYIGYGALALSLIIAFSLSYIK